MSKLSKLAEELVITARQEAYGHPYDDFKRTTGMLTALGFRFVEADGKIRNLQPTDHAVILLCVKLSREMHQHKEDNIVDLFGYVKCLEMVLEKEKFLNSEKEPTCSLSPAVDATWNPPPIEIPADDDWYPNYPHPDDAVINQLVHEGLITEKIALEAKVAAKEDKTLDLLCEIMHRGKVKLMDMYRVINECNSKN